MINNLKQMRTYLIGAMDRVVDGVLDGEMLSHYVTELRSSN